MTIGQTPSTAPSPGLISRALSFVGVVGETLRTGWCLAIEFIGGGQSKHTFTYPEKSLIKNAVETQEQFQAQLQPMQEQAEQVIKTQEKVTNSINNLKAGITDSTDIPKKIEILKNEIIKIKEQAKKCRNSKGKILAAKRINRRKKQIETLKILEIATLKNEAAEIFGQIKARKAVCDKEGNPWKEESTVLSLNNKRIEINIKIENAEKNLINQEMKEIEKISGQNYQHK
ncbi:hypothetical protein RINTU1_12910 [Candidatus Regiella insecticola]|uniref:Uncharacterized protein n=2 Tax=Candidatus Regiella insecticola TaxID=138073 RepID=A0A6L2ZME1_9ENTR|nr:hypothetical protein RINTU1_12910 [Candidatus Regiella insecticola]